MKLLRCIFSVTLPVTLLMLSMTGCNQKVGQGVVINPSSGGPKPPKASTPEVESEEDEHESESEVASQEPQYEKFDPANFDDPTTLDNPWYPLKPGMRLTWEGTSIDVGGEEEPHRVVFTVTDLIKEIGGIETVVCWDQDFVRDQLVETEIIFFAQDNDGALWSLGEYPEEYEDGEFVVAPTFIHGIKGSYGGILIPADPKVGSPSFSQGWAPDVDFTDRGIVDAVGQKTTVPFGTYEDVLVIDEWNLAEPDTHALKYYARGVGHVRVGTRGPGDQETLELVNIEQLGPEEMTEARNAALKLEAYAFARSKEVYALSEPSEYAGSGQIEIPTFELPPELVQSEAPVVRKITDDQAKEIALKAIPGDVTGLKLERKLGKQRIVVEMLDKEGTEVDVIIDMETGEVLMTET